MPCKHEARGSIPRTGSEVIKMSFALVVLTIAAALAFGLLIGLRVNLQKTIAMCERCKHYQARCAKCMASRANYE